MQKTSVSHIVVGDFATNCWIYPLAETDTVPGPSFNKPMPPGFHGCALIDPGAEADRIIAYLNSHALVPLYILLTHGHFDHIAALPPLVSKYRRAGASGAWPIVAIHAADARYLGPGSYHVHCHSFASVMGSSSAAAYIDALWEDMPPPDLTLEEGSDIGPFTVLHLPGHTPGSIALWDKNARVLFSGDTLFQDGYGRTDLPGGNESQLIASLKRLFAMDREIDVYPGHGAGFIMGRRE